MKDFDYFRKQKQNALINSMDAIDLVVKHVTEFRQLHAANKSLDIVETFFYDTLRVSKNDDTNVDMNSRTNKLNIVFRLFTTLGSSIYGEIVVICQYRMDVR